ncbi:[FeFe] hydrogenase H-cluster radical SAM maturase HydE [Bacteroides sp. 214]|uniref:[FeFe] hydrogenase H-cluster radical SAM maturase HydE n=1 Tax=Bacteroides sp. 214 TaxID=2302935 RepID=UPI0013D0D159|nr:[FeFe] hydrogenase H-cluster radical SAM maturase HydE [Bacteroides sp. 214]NDW12405.1 [FeFe] hydrogenase H-cluster radical SAM maturase HydE [Bacteroides sp. 214]
MRKLIDNLKSKRCLSREDITLLLTSLDEDLLIYINKVAREATDARFGKTVYARGLIELTNYCRNNCYYCGIRRENKQVERYRLTADEILECCRQGDRLGLKTFVLQGGEDPRLTDNFLEDVLLRIKKEFPNHAVTFSLGEKSRESYQKFFAAGADRYLLRHETATREHYQQLHPEDMSFDNRINCLHELKAIGYQTGAGMMIGSPGQTVENIVEDILFIKKLRPQMVGIGPFIPQHDTPFANEPAGSIDLTLMVISIIRLLLPDALMPSTTALATLNQHGYQRGILAGANVVMPNLTPQEYRAKYAIYDNKKAMFFAVEQEFEELKQQITSIGYHLSNSRGDYHNTFYHV